MASTIHPSAVVDPAASIGADCQIGPGCIVGPHVTLGPGCRLLSHAVITGHTTLGEGCEVHPFSVLGGQTQDLKHQGGTCYTRIGARNVIREYVTINAATNAGDATVVGDDCLIQSYCHIAHDCILGNGIILSSGAMLSGHIVVDDFAVIGGMVGIVQFVRIGTMGFVGGMSKLAGDVMPYCIADGGPAITRTVNKIGMQRRGRSDDAVRVVREAFKTVFRSGLRLEDAVAKLREDHPDSPEVADMIAFATSPDAKVGLARSHD